MRKILITIASLLLTVTAGAATFSLFQPATGVLKGSSSTYVTTAAASSDIRAMWSGTCNSGTFLRGDGTCATTSGGSVTSVALTVPTGFSVTGSPVTTSGTLGITTALSGVLKGNGSGFTTSSASDIVGLFTGCSGVQYLGADGACHAAGGGTPGGSNTQVQFNNSGAFGGDAGLTWDNAVKELAVTSGLLTTTIDPGFINAENNTNNITTIAIQNDSAGTIAQSAFSAFNDTNNGALFSLSSTGYSGSQVTGGPTGQSLAIFTNNTGMPISIGTANTERIRIDAAGASINLKATSVQVNGVAICQSDGTNCPVGSTCTTGTFTGTLSGMTGSVTGTVRWRVCGNIAWLWTTSAITGTSNTTAMNLTGLSAAVQSTNSHLVPCSGVEDNSNTITASCLANGATITMEPNKVVGSFIQPDGSGFTSSGTKGFIAAFNVSYPLD